MLLRYRLGAGAGDHGPVDPRPGVVRAGAPPPTPCRPTDQPRADVGSGLPYRCWLTWPCSTSYGFTFPAYFFTPIPAIVRNSPDIGLVIILITLMATAWGSARTVLLLRTRPQSPASA